MSLALDPRFRIATTGACPVITIAANAPLPAVPPAESADAGLPASSAPAAAKSKSQLKKEAKAQVVGEKKDKKEKPVR